MIEQSQKQCAHCQQYTLHGRPGTNHLVHALMTLFLCGMWLPIWFLSCCKIGGWRCQACGYKSGTLGYIMLITLVVIALFGYFALLR